MSKRALKPTEKLHRDFALEELMDTPGLYLNDHYQKKWKQILSDLIRSVNSDYPC